LLPGWIEIKNPISIKDLLARQQPSLNRLRAGAQAADHIFAAVQQFLPPDCSGSVWTATLDDGVLTLVTSNGSWATRLRYASPQLLPKLATELGEPITKAVIRVRPQP
jgi:hypothetical protein